MLLHRDGLSMSARDQPKQVVEKLASNKDALFCRMKSVVCDLWTKVKCTRKDSQRQDYSQFLPILFGMDLMPKLSILITRWISSYQVSCIISIFLCTHFITQSTIPASILPIFDLVRPLNIVFDYLIFYSNVFLYIS